MIIDERIFNESKTNDLVSNVSELIGSSNSSLYEDYEAAEDPNEPTAFDRISRSSLLYEALIKFFGSEEAMKEHVRSFYHNEHTNEIFWVHGVGYDYIDKDLLGGNGSGNTTREFLTSINK